MGAGMTVRFGNLAGRPPLGLKDRAAPKRFSTAEARYYRWLHRLPCCLSDRQDIEIAHTGGLAEGKGMGRKAALWTCLPLARPLHLAEETGRERFWAGAGLDRLPWAARLYDVYEAGGDMGDALALVRDMQDAADRDFLVTILRKHLPR